MRIIGLGLVLLAGPALAEPMRCRAPGLSISVDLLADGCRINDDMALRRDEGGSVVCLLSNPQLRIVTFAPDGGFVYEDTDDDSRFEGRCTAAGG